MRFTLKKVSASFLVVFVGIVISFCSFLAFYYRSLYVKERARTQILQKKVDEIHKVIPPYYDPESFTKPSFVRSKSLSNETAIKIPIIMYHYVEYVKDDNDLIKKKLDVAPHEFEGHLKALSDAKYDTYFVKDIPDIINGTVAYSTRSAILTFDDGYADFYTTAFPLLKKYHMRATVYIITHFTNKKGFLSAPQIQELANSGLVEIGSHTLDHLYLKRVSKAVEEKQIGESKKELEKQLGIEIQTFAYPFGAFDADTVELVKKAGYTAAVSVIPGVMQSGTNVLFLNRIRPGLFTANTMIQTIEKMQK